MKRIVSLLLAMMLILALTSCGNTNISGEVDELEPEYGPSIENEEPSSDSQTTDETLLTESDTENDSSASELLAVSSAVYPETVPYPDEMNYVNDEGRIDETFWDALDLWDSANRERRTLLADYEGELNSFFTDSIRQYLSDSQGQNKIYSPVNVYMALGMLAEVTDGESRGQVLGLLGEESVENLRARANTIWNANYQNDGANTSILASSLWLNEDVNFVQPTLDMLAENYYASSYQGVMGSDELNRALQNWLNEQTGGLLDDQVSGVSLDDNTIMALATTINYRARWNGDEEFFKELTHSDVFHGATGDIDCDFMYQDKSMIYWGEKFSAVVKHMQSDGNMWFILPDEGVSVDELLEDEEAMEFILGDKYGWENSEFITVHLAVPKFDVSSDIDLIPGLKTLGVTDIFDPSISDFTPMTTDVGEIYLSQAQHAARVKIDEEGCTAASYTVLAAAGAGLPPEEEVDFVLDRPFIFVITGGGDLPLFVGIVNQPIE